eukprot:69150_1
MSAAEEMIPTIDVTKISVSPNECPLERELKVQIDFTSNDAIPSASWTMTYVVDHASKRHIIELGERTQQTYNSGENSFNFEVDSVNVTSVKPNILLNVGMLHAVMKDSTGREIIEVKMVTQINRNSDGKLYRTIFNPLE